MAKETLLHGGRRYKRTSGSASRQRSGGDREEKGKQYRAYGSRGAHLLPYLSSLFISHLPHLSPHFYSLTCSVLLSVPWSLLLPPGLASSHLLDNSLPPHNAPHIPLHPLMNRGIPSVTSGTLLSDTLPSLTSEPHPFQVMQ